MVVDASDRESEVEFDLEALQQALCQINNQAPKEKSPEPASDVNTNQEERVHSRKPYPKARQK
jgi:hypothetical protein